METNKSGNKQTRIDDSQGMLVGGLIFEEIRTTEALKSLPVWQIDHATNHFAEDKVRTILVNIGSMFDGDERVEEQKAALDFLRQTYLLCNETEVTLDNLFDDIIPLYFERFEQMLNTGKPIVEIKHFERSIDNLRLFTNDIKIEVDGKLYGIDDNCNEILQQIKIQISMNEHLKDAIARQTTLLNEWQERHDALNTKYNELLIDKEIEILKLKEQNQNLSDSLVDKRKLEAELDESRKKIDTLEAKLNEEVKNSSECKKKLASQSKNYALQKAKSDEDYQCLLDDYESDISIICQVDEVLKKSGLVKIKEGPCEHKSLVNHIQELVAIAANNIKDSSTHIDINTIKQAVISRAEHLDNRDNLHSFLLEINELLGGTAWEKIREDVKREAFAALGKNNAQITFNINKVDTLAPNATTVTNNHYKDNNGQG